MTKHSTQRRPHWISTYYSDIIFQVYLFFWGHIPHFIYNLRLTLISKSHIHAPIYFLLILLTRKCMVCPTKTVKKCLPRLLHGTQEQLVAEIYPPPPQHFFFIINTGITTILNIFLILLVVSTNTNSKINTICDSICCTYYFKRFQLKLLHSARWTEHTILGFLLELSLQKHTCLHSHLTRVTMLPPANLSSPWVLQVHA